MKIESESFWEYAELRHGDSTEEDTSTNTGAAVSTADNVADNTPAPPNIVAIVLGVMCGVLVLLLLCGGIGIGLILRKTCKIRSCLDKVVT